MATIELHLSSGGVLRPSGALPGSVEEVRDLIAATIERGSTINLHTPEGVHVVNTAHVMFAVVTP